MPELTDAEFDAFYGSWQPPALEDLPALLGPVRWWVVGGWALELFSGVTRPHHDVDVAVPRSQLPLLVEQLAGHHFWTAHSGALTPLAHFDGAMPEDHEQLWIRRDSSSPWLLDVQLQRGDDGHWVFKKDARIRVPMDLAIRDSGGVPYLAPEITLLHKAHLCRPQDERDLEVVLPLLDDAARAWLREALAIAVPASPWNARV